MIFMGLDLSINSSGICIYNAENKKTIYYIIGSKFTKKALSSSQIIVNLQSYDKKDIDKNSEYYIKENTKTHNIYNIVNEIEKLILKYKPNVISIEGVSFQSSGSVVDLAGLNYMVRNIAMNNNINIFIASPTQNKKFATGNGQAEKDVMISAWKKADPKVLDIPSCIKIDDLADAYFLARYAEFVYNIKIDDYIDVLSDD